MSDVTAVEVDTGTGELLCSIRERVATVTLNRPHKKNSLSDQLTPALREILLQLEARQDVGCVLLTGAGDAFCSGGDVSGMGGGAAANSKTPATEQAAEERAEESAEESAEDRSAPTRAMPNIDERVAELIRKQEALTLRLYELSKPTVAALPGAAAGAGLSIALACDLRVAAQTAFITTAFINIGISGDYGSSWFLNRLIGQSKAKELMFFADRVSAEECARLGLINRVFPTETFRTDAFAYAKKLANGPSMALSRMKRNINRGALQGLRESLAMEAEHVIASFQTEDAAEAVRAFMEKRDPRFTGR